jgi:hypothetical protein
MEIHASPGLWIELWGIELRGSRLTRGPDWSETCGTARCRRKPRIVAKASGKGKNRGAPRAPAMKRWLY